MEGPELREGDSLRAQFFRWKDEVFPRGVSFLPSEDQHHVALSNQNMTEVWVPFRGRMKALVDNPDDVKAYEELCGNIRRIHVLLVECGADLAPWKDPP